MQLSHDAGPVLLELLAELDRRGYDFVAPTPATHARVVARADRRVARTLRDIFGWSLPFTPALLDADLRDALGEAGLLVAEDGLLRSRVRVSRVAGRLFVHSAYPTEAADSVFLGPDSYRFASFLHADLLDAGPVRRLVDIGAGAGVGAIVAAPLVAGARLTLTDVNGSALALAAANARYAGIDVELVEGAGIDAVAGAVDLFIANPPFIMDDKDRAYRDGGGLHGAQLSRDWAIAAAKRLAPGGRILLYTGVAIVEGRDVLREQLEGALPDLDCTLDYRELDPDIFGEELDKPAYADVERIAAVGAVIAKA